MDTNYLLSPLQDFFQEVSYFNGNLYIVDSLIGSRSKQIKEDFPVPQDLWQTGTYFRDVTLHPDVVNLFPTGFGYDVGTSTLDQQSLRSISFICCNTIASVYEVFDTYLKDILANVYVNTDHKPAFKLKDNHFDIESVRANLWQVRSDKGFIKIIRRIAPSFQTHEIKNIYKYNLGNWYNMIDMTRHQIVHNRQQATPAFCNELKKKYYLKLFEKSFSIGEADSKLIMITYGQASQILCTFMEYAYLIFKSLSMELALNYEQTLPTYRPIVNVFQK